MRRLAVMLVAVAGCASTANVPDGGERPDARRGPDAAIDASAIDARPIDARPIDAMTIDAPPIDACVPGPQQKLVNGNLDSSPIGTGWTQLPMQAQYPPIVTPPPGPTADSAPNLIWLGGLLSSTDALYQQIAIPADATGLSIQGKKWFVTQEPGGAADVIKVQIRSTADQVLETVVTWSNLDVDATWTPFTLTPTGDYRGQTIRLYLQSTTDSSFNTNFFLDTLSLNLTACP